MNKLELSPEELAALPWKKSGRSIANSGCVEVALIPSGGAAVRDSKDPDGPWLFFTAAEWDAFTGGAKDGEFDL